MTLNESVLFCLRLKKGSSGSGSKLRRAAAGYHVPRLGPEVMLGG